MDKGEAAKRLDVVSHELRGLYSELTEIMKGKRSAYASAFLSLPEGLSFSERDKRSALNAHPNDQEELEFKGQIQVLEEERDHLRFMLKYNLEGHMQ